MPRRCSATRSGRTRLARAGRRIEAARPCCRRDRRTRPGGAPLSRRGMAGRRRRSISCPGRRTSRCCARRGCSSDPTPRSTHLAAATGCPTVALFGPTDPRLGAMAGRRARHALAGERHNPESRQRLDRAEPAAVSALHLRGLRAAYRQRQRVPGGTRRAAGARPRPIRRCDTAAERCCALTGGPCPLQCPANASPSRSRPQAAPGLHRKPDRSRRRKAARRPMARRTPERRGAPAPTSSAAR